MKSSIHDGMDFCLSGRVFEKSYSENALSLEAFFKCAAHNGFKSVELRDSQIGFDASSKDIDKVRMLSETHGLYVALITARKAKLDNEGNYSIFRKYLELAKNIGCRQIKVSGTGSPLLKRAADDSGKHEIKIGMNNHIGTPLETIDGTIEFFTKMNHPNFHLLFDPSHLWLKGENRIGELIDKMIEKITYMIIQDYRESDSGDLHGIRRVVPISIGETGDVGYPQIIEKLVSRKFKGPFGLVYLGDADMAQLGTDELKRHYMKYFTRWKYPSQKLILPQRTPSM
jgi:sugar phosphate isomerase/epimerase